jgi:hypothetical protein
MSATNLEACALDAAGALKPASDITWYNDADDEVPMVTPPVAPTVRPLAASSSTSSLSQGTLNNYVQLKHSGKVPASLVAGSRRSGRAPKPSAKIRDAAPSIPSIPAKRTATTSSATASRKRVSTATDTDIDLSSDGDALFEDSIDSDDLPDLRECSDDEDDNDEEARLAAKEFDRNQALADADRDVSISLLLNIISTVGC